MNIVCFAGDYSVLVLYMGIFRCSRGQQRQRSIGEGNIHCRFAQMAWQDGRGYRSCSARVDFHLLNWNVKAVGAGGRGLGLADCP